MESNFHFIRKIKRNAGLSDFRPILTDSKEILKAINLNAIKDYIKVPVIKEGDILICCEKKDSFTPQRNLYLSRVKGAGWQNNYIFKVTSVLYHSNYIIPFGALRSCGVYLDECRFATKEEIETFKKQ